MQTISCEFKHAALAYIHTVGSGLISYSPVDALFTCFDGLIRKCMHGTAARFD